MLLGGQVKLGLILTWLLQIKGQTVTSTGCSCQFDPLGVLLDPLDCACCADRAIQCGFPLHNQCKYDFDQPEKGCEGLPNKKYTLSRLGGPCPGNATDLSCAICTLGNFPSTLF